MEIRSPAFKRGYCKYYALQVGLDEVPNPYPASCNEFFEFQQGFNFAYGEQCRSKLEMGPAIYRLFGSVEV